MAIERQHEREEKRPGDGLLPLAHDVRNLLMGAAGQAELLEEEEADGGRAERLRSLRFQVGHAATLLEDLLRRGLGALPESADFDLGTAALSAATALRAGAGRALRIELVDPGARVVVHGLEHDVVRAACNLMWNALNAMVGARVASPRVDLLWGRNGQGAFLAVRDYGPGLPAGHARPRRAGPGADGLIHGLGLESVRQVMAEHGGELRAEAPADGAGAVMRLQFGLQRRLDFGA